MAIQNRRGAYTDFDKSKMVAGEFAVVLEDDPNTSDGKAVYLAFASGSAKRLMTVEDAQADLDAAVEDATEDAQSAAAAAEASAEEAATTKPTISGTTITFY